MFNPYTASAVRWAETARDQVDSWTRVQRPNGGACSSKPPTSRDTKKRSSSTTTGDKTMTKKDIAGIIETLVEQVAVNNGATIVEKTIKVGGRETQSRVAVDGMFDLDACRRIVAHAITTNKELLLAGTPGHKPAAAKLAEDTAAA